MWDVRYVRREVRNGKQASGSWNPAHGTRHIFFFLAFEQVVDIFDIIEGIVYKEIEFRNGTHLVVYTVAEFKSDLFTVFLNHGQ